ncbi:MAG: ABC transporter substrate-binding protein [Planctomycetes bacterium]|nr:ABC transporter substrate-binding protein [Planctomycetota bacterium]
MRLVLPLVLAALGCAACSDPEPTPVVETPTREITLPGGETLTIPERAVRILPMSAAAVDYAIALVPRERIVAVPAAAVRYACSLQRGEPWPEDRLVPEFSAEAMLAWDPDLVIAHVWQVPAEALEMVADSGVAVLRLDEVESMQDVLDAVRVVASAVDEPRAGAQLVHDLEQRIAALRAGAAERSELRAISYTNFGSGGWSAGSGTTAQILIELTGMRNAGAEGGRAGHYELDIERLLELDPDLIVLSESTDEYSPTLTFLQNEPALASLRALERDWIVPLPAALFSTNSHHLVETAERLAAGVDALREQPR